MRLPTRKAERDKHLLTPADEYATPAMISKMERELNDLIQNQRQPAADEVHRTAQMGDLSENAAYQFAKMHLRRVNSRILKLEDGLKRVIPISTGPADGKVRIGSKVILRTGDKTVTYEILGSLESNPARGRISYLSPLGALLMEKSINETVTLNNLGYVIVKLQ